MTNLIKLIRSTGRVQVAAVLIGFGLALTACSSVKEMLSNPFGDDPDSVNDTTPVGMLYNEGLDYIKDGRYKKAVERFDEVERQHPYSTWATRATLMIAYSHYQSNSYDDAINAAERFIKLHPGNKDAAYAYYLRGLSYYEQIGSTNRDQTATQKALETLEEVTRRFPNSRYADDVKGKAVLARDHLASKEMKVGRYYLKRHAHVAAINRFKKVITDYQTTSHTPEALERLTEAYYALGITLEAQTAAAILGHNFPNSQWYKDAYALLRSGGLEPKVSDKSWLTEVWQSVSSSS